MRRFHNTHTMAETYRQRLRVEGLTLATAGLAGSALLLAVKRSRAAGGKHRVQLGVLAVGLATLGARSTDKTRSRSAGRVRFGRVGTGEPTPLWHVPVPMAGGAIFLGRVAKPLNKKLGLPKRLARDAGWDAVCA